MINAAVVVGLPHDEDGKRSLAFVVLKPCFEHVTVDQLVNCMAGVSSFRHFCVFL